MDQLIDVWSQVLPGKSQQSRAGFLSIMVTYTGEMPLLPKDSTAKVEEVLEIDHRSDSVEQEAKEMRERDVRDAVG